ncbi:dentin sialophosphoprotein-like isoform X2 [Carex littledalei]|uniref:Dentin sialophosphoprotein-like isoform X2 n=1 Tax=Carex littledalei TaxID=544730 RepID=A0A833RHZ3_9POAL|nr:dentin sialophosphoprotein-like isoform X2 [Carex littledalei]
MPSSDSFVIYIRSSHDFNFAVVASSDDDISSLKKEAETQHLALFPHNGRIVSQAIKIWRDGIAYNLSDNIPVRCLFDVDGGNKGKHLLYMDAVPVTVPPDEVPPTGRDRDCSLNQNQGGNNNTNCASDALKRKDPVVEEMTTGVAVLRENNNSSKEKKSKEVDLDPSSSSSSSSDDDDDYEAPPSNASVEESEPEPESESRKTGGDRMQERSACAAPENENETAGIHVVTWNPEAASADVVVLDAAAPGGNADGSNYNKKENSMAWVKEARKESTTNAAASGETCSLAPSDSDLRDKGTLTPDNLIKDNNASSAIPNTTDKEKMNKSQNNSISATDSIAASPSDKKKRRTREKVVLSLPPIIERDYENEISREDASKKKKRKQQDATQQLDLCQNGDPSSGRDRDCSLNQNQGGNANSTSEALKRKSLGDNTNFDILLDAASADMEVQDAAPKGNESYKERENNMTLEEEEAILLATPLKPRGRVKAKKASQPIPKTDKKKMKKSQNNSISATDKKRRRGTPKKNKIKIDASQVAVMVPDKLRCCRNSGSGWRCFEKAMPNSKFCTRHGSKSTSSKKYVLV